MRKSKQSSQEKVVFDQVLILSHSQPHIQKEHHFLICKTFWTSDSRRKPKDYQNSRSDSETSNFCEGKH